ncbi:OVARIAN TUMOR DOMAIN-containing deubiquitinating enzyme 12-like isoform X2 [Salvia miltiorrhiza]|uniref:OVARIAN TUMOR DOMAIN-containing deubiquitinating enzyme 12-like isoform X2 n=1 Tax=Salvia miltiorrhiza TaxID=226208 RepID=UPI0025AC857A|nr:OVARIAN TUMOR DOMAIN-containing deubiquitinating enzyme 12-like isoform X2 [Salvia miltiorrhiza]XP_057798919.1 OVARIAN TUMOR DOMAIN-containing deubiquitinating enzyme 12-like isoform X2 [Salvia miltiorrhiza]XP_057798920.1 OVARIAN TUMOR DOMAIN-containing deubiquitinating enzyme 12-like isoform X2 [Salvia miltiorrhiza]
MTMYEQDRDMRWDGFHLIDVCSLSNGYPETVTCYAKDLSWTESVTEGFCNPEPSFEENNTHAPQEDFSRFPAAYPSEFSSTADHHHGESSAALDWPGNSEWHSSSGLQAGELSHENINQDCVPEIEDEPALYDEMGKRLNQMVPVPHVPKINGEIPSADEVSSDHERLLNRLQLYDLVELKILGDGNCQFRSLSDQIYRTPEHHNFVREQIVNQLKSQPEMYANYVPMAYGDYLKKMSKSGEWGDHVTLQAAADCYGVRIIVLTSFKDTCYIEILPQFEKSNRIILLSFWAEVHYNSIYPCGESPVEGGKKKKRSWWT